MADLATRNLPLAGRHGGSATVRLTPAAPASRIFAARTGGLARRPLFQRSGLSLPRPAEDVGTHR